ncbi:hypothetical protein BN1723_013289 [Verticillium longisporum]|uniref:Glucose receptor Git3-like N-terminal domain-containing protein n=1 Tax=Verticillium longisporum TaxID=100787 RepID=A0A0G4LQS7_VERLO|nr:hypothetical protein BN1723_013289 [Verticillium longisporum]
MVSFRWLMLAAVAGLANGLADTDTITWGGDNSRAGYQTNHNMDPAVVRSSQFDRIFQTTLPGRYGGRAEQIFSQPLVYTPDDKHLAPEGLPRIRQAFQNMKKLAEFADVELYDCVRLVVYVTDMFRYRPLVNQVQIELWGTDANKYPPRTIIEVDRLNQDDIVEVEGTFHMPHLIYGLGNTIPGAVFLINGRTPSPFSKPSTLCLVSGWFSQANAQHIDFNILIISIIVLLSVVKKDSIAELDTKWQVLICFSAWLPGFTTGTIGLALNSYGYVSGNWCWIRSNRLDLRYGLSHGWRITIFFVTIVIYTYIYIKLKRVFKGLRNMSTATGTRRKTDHMVTVPSDPDNNDTQKILVAHSVSVSHEMQNLPRTPDTADHEHGYNNDPVTQSTVTASGTDSRPFEASRMPAAPNVRKMLLMNGYPIAYIILWMPGIANRLAESVGKSPRWLSAMQASTQYIGLINALTYGLSEQMRQGVWKKLKDTGGRR